MKICFTHGIIDFDCLPSTQYDFSIGISFIDLPVIFKLNASGSELPADAIDLCKNASGKRRNKNREILAVFGREVECLGRIETLCEMHISENYE